MNIEQIAMAAIASLAPFSPFLVEMGKEGGNKLAEVIAAKGGEAAWEQAQKVWQAIKRRFQDDAKVEKVTELVALDPDNDNYHKLLGQLLVERMQADDAFADELLAAMGGQEAAQSMIATHHSTIKNAQQNMEGTGRQEIRADDHSRIEDVSQNIKQTRR